MAEYGPRSKRKTGNGDTAIGKRSHGRHFVMMAVLLIHVGLQPGGRSPAPRRPRRPRAWNGPYSIPLNSGPAAVGTLCEGAGTFNYPGQSSGYVAWPIANVLFQTGAYAGLNTAVCQRSKPYQPGLDLSQYFNQTSFAFDELGLAQMVGYNANNGVNRGEVLVRRQLSERHVRPPVVRFNYFPGGLVVVALYGEPDNGQTFPYESIIDKPRAGQLAALGFGARRIQRTVFLLPGHGLHRRLRASARARDIRQTVSSRRAAFD
jgi:hypothetical protein